MVNTNGFSSRHNIAGIAKIFGIVIMLFIATSVTALGMASAQTSQISCATSSIGSSVTGNTGSAIICQICNLYNTIHSIVFVLALLLFIFGGVMYAVAHILPGKAKGEFQGYAWAMIIGGIIAVIIVIAAPFVLNSVVSTGGTSTSTILSGQTGGIAGACGALGGSFL